MYSKLNSQDTLYIQSTEMINGDSTVKILQPAAKVDIVFFFFSQLLILLKINIKFGNYTSMID